MGCIYHDHGTFTNIDNNLGPKASLTIFKLLKSYINMFFEQWGIKLTVNNFLKLQNSQTYTN